MPKPIEFHQGAREDFDDSFDWYAKRIPEAAIAFAAAIDDAILEALANPHRFQVHSVDVGTANLNTFLFESFFATSLIVLLSSRFHTQNAVLDIGVTAFESEINSSAE